MKTLYNREDMKKCKSCKNLIEESQFYKRLDSTDGLYHSCIRCMKNRTANKYKENPELKHQKNIEWAKNNPQKMSAISRKYHSKNKPKEQRDKLLSRYGLTQEQYDLMCLKQDNKCSICKETCSSGKNLSVDHCHSTGKIRGLLCKKCNLGLGNFRDSLIFLENAKKYLEKT